jgi:hypothetical protein
MRVSPGQSRLPERIPAAGSLPPHLAADPNGLLERLVDRMRIVADLHDSRLRSEIASTAETQAARLAVSRVVGDQDGTMQAQQRRRGGGLAADALAQPLDMGLQQQRGGTGDRAGVFATLSLLRKYGFPMGLFHELPAFVRRALTDMGACERCYWEDHSREGTTCEENNRLRQERRKRRRTSRTQQFYERRARPSLPPAAAAAAPAGAAPSQLNHAQDAQQQPRQRQQGLAPPPLGGGAHGGQQHTPPPRRPQGAAPHSRDGDRQRLDRAGGQPSQQRDGADRRPGGGGPARRPGGGKRKY